MSPEEQAAALMQIKRGMVGVQFIAESLSWKLLELEASGMALPKTKTAIAILGQIALGWEAGGFSDEG